MKTSPGPSGKPPREAATPTADGLDLLVKPSWLKPGIDLDIDNRNALYGLFDEDEDLPGEYRP